jgi:hypothetical protein
MWLCEWSQRGGFIWTTNATDTAWRTPMLSCNRYHGYFKRPREKSHLGIYSLEGKYEKMWNMQTAGHVLVGLNKVCPFSIHRDRTRGCGLSLSVILGTVGISFIQLVNLTCLRFWACFSLVCFNKSQILWTMYMAESYHVTSFYCPGVGLKSFLFFTLFIWRRKLRKTGTVFPQGQSSYWIVVAVTDIRFYFLRWSSG